LILWNGMPICTSTAANHRQRSDCESNEVISERTYMSSLTRVYWLWYRCWKLGTSQTRTKFKWKFNGLSLWANYTDRATAACRRRLVPTLADRGCLVVSVTDPYGRILGFLDGSRYFFFQVAPQLYSWGWLDPVSDPILRRKSSSAGNPTQTSGSIARISDH
jgi:hypothetical protein